jgi:hypothetical protein
MPSWPEEARLAWQMYETTTAGTPLSPPCASAKELAKWLSVHHASAGPNLLATEGEWLAMIEGSCVSPMYVLDQGRAACVFAKRK